jgi:DNA-binding beta-propeller fold protein YncE
MTRQAESRGGGRARFAAACCLWLFCAAPHALAAALELTATIGMPGVKGRIDHLSVDVRGHRLFVAALGNDTVEILDTEHDEHRSITGLGEPQGVLYLPDPGALVIANGSANRVDVVDAASLQRLARIDGLEDADNVRPLPGGRSVLVGYGRGALRVITVPAGSTGDIRLPGHPESFEVDAAGERAYVNVPSAHAVVVVDLVRRRAIARWETPFASANFPLALDVHGRRLFVATRSPALLLVYDIDMGNIVARLPIGRDADDLYFDEQRKRVYVICGEGRVDVIREASPHEYVPQEQVATAPGARTGLFVAEQAKLYVAAPARQDAPAKILVFNVR